MHYKHMYFRAGKLAHELNIKGRALIIFYGPTGPVPNERVGIVSRLI